MKITDGIYTYIWKSMFENNCNMYYFGEPLNILFDPGLMNYFDVRQIELEKDGFSRRQRRAIKEQHKENIRA